LAFPKGELDAKDYFFAEIFRIHCYRKSYPGASPVANSDSGFQGAIFNRIAIDFAGRKKKQMHLTMCLQ